RLLHHPRCPTGRWLPTTGRPPPTKFFFVVFLSLFSFAFLYLFFYFFLIKKRKREEASSSLSDASDGRREGSLPLKKNRQQQPTIGIEEEEVGEEGEVEE
ncbi:MAG: hypothetical protein Q8835_02670, partial [Sweet potato little leaf phytoplasma]|nr:hypothetical protein [Sweet potato little leaf phytoplasma]